MSFKASLIKFFLGAFTLATTPSPAQCDLTDARQIVLKYIEKAGGLERIQKVQTMEKLEWMMAGKDTVKLHTRLIRNEAYKLVRTSGGFTQTAIMKEGRGINKTSEGTFEMPADQVARYRREMSIVPELLFLSEEYTLTYQGKSFLNDTTEVYEVRLTDTLGNSEIRGYNCRTGLLEVILRSGGQIIRYGDYRNIDGIWLPFRQQAGRNTFYTSKIHFDVKIKSREFIWNGKNEEKFIGTWLILKPVKESGQREYSEFHLSSSRGGVERMGVIMEDGEKVPIEALAQDIVGWKVEQDTLIIQYFNRIQQKLIQKKIIFSNLKKDQFNGYIESSSNSEGPRTEGKNGAVIHTFIRQEE